jgi:hypothetical protein
MAPIYITLIIFMTFFHPSTTVLLILIFGSMSLVALFIGDARAKRFFTISIIGGVSLTFWLTSSFTPGNFTRTVYGLLGIIDRGTPKPGAATIERSQSLPLLETIIRFTEIYGGFAIYAVGGLVASLLIIYLSINSGFWEQDPILFTAQYYIGGVTSLLILLTGIPFADHWVRNIRYSMLFTTIEIPLGIVAATSISRLEKLPKLRNLILLLFISVIVFSSLLSLSAVYDSGAPITKHEVSGAEWVSEYQVEDPVFSYTIRNKILRSQMGWMSFDSSDQPGFESVRLDRPLEEVAQGTGHYYTTLEREIITSIYGRTDVRNTANKHSVNKLYTNGEMQVWRT